MPKAEIDVIRRVFGPETDSNFIEVGPWADSPSDTLELRTTGECADWFGGINLTMSPEFARALGKALIDSANEINPETP